MFQFQASVADSIKPVLCIWYGQLKPLKCYNWNSSCNSIETQNVESMLFWCWASVADSDTTLSQQRYKSMCVLGTLHAIPFDKQIYI